MNASLLSSGWLGPSMIVVGLLIVFGSLAIKFPKRVP